MPPKEKIKRLAEKKLFSYSPDALRNALEAIRSGTSVRLASKTFGVPRTTLRHKIHGSVPETTRQVGPPPVLGSNVEKKLASWLIETSRMGFPIDRECLLYSVKQLVDAKNLHTPFKDNLPGRKWFEGFMKRHPERSQKKAEYLSKSRAVVTEENIRKWFSNVEELIEEDMQILQHPQRIFNMDETAIFRAPKGGLVLGQKGKAVYDVSSASDKEAITTLFTVNADGGLAPPLTMYKYTRIPRACLEAAPAQWGIGKSGNGWMDTASFYEYFTNVFYPYLLEKNIPLPVIVFLDGHVSHLSYHLSQFCRDKKIIVCCLPPNTTHILQLLDVASFAPLKQQWKKFVRLWRLKHDGVDIQKFEIPLALSQIVSNGKFSETIEAGFRACGLYPFDPNSVDYSECVQQKRTTTTDEENTIGNIITPTTPHIQYLESKIPANVLKKFEETLSTNSAWTADIEHAALYKVWLEFRQNADKSVRPQIFDPQFNNTNEEVHALVENTVNSDTLIFDFPELQATLDGVESSFNVEDMQLNRNDEAENQETCLDDANRTSDSVVSQDKELEENKMTNTNSLTSQHSSENLNDHNPQTTENIITVKKSVDETLQSIPIYPEPKPSKKRQYKRDPLPSVITSDKWVEIMDIKETEKRIKIENQKKRSRGTKNKGNANEHQQQNIQEPITTKKQEPKKRKLPQKNTAKNVRKTPKTASENVVATASTSKDVTTSKRSTRTRVAKKT